MKYLPTSMYNSTKFLFLLTIVVAVCGCDDFYETHRFFSTDKSQYNVGDSIFLTLHIVPQEENKEIRVYENFENISVYGSLQIEYQLKNGEITQTGSGKGVKTIRNEKGPADEVVRYKISPQKPFEKTFKGLIKEDGKNYIIDFKDDGLTIIVEKEKYAEALFFEISGHCMPINPEFAASLEEYIEPVSIQLN